MVVGQAGAQLDRGGRARPVDELLQQLPGRSLLEGSGAKEGGLDRCAGVRGKGEVDGELVRGVRCPGLPGRDQFLESDVRPVRLDAGGHRLGDGGEPQRRDHTELAAARAAQTPEQVWFVVVVAIHDAAVWEHDLCADEAIAGQPVLAPEQTDPAAKGEAGDADGGTAPGWQGPAVGV